MNRRALLGVLAFVLALVGGVLVYVYVQGADARALAAQQPTPVLVAARPIPTGTSVADLAQYTEVRQVPRAAVVPGAVADMGQLPPDGRVRAGFSVGEQILSSRFGESDANPVSAPVPIPDGLQLISFQLPAEQVIGSRIVAGDRVGMIVYGDLAPLGGTNPPGEPVARLIANNLLVARVQGAPAQPADGAAPTPEPISGEAVPAGDVMVTLAVDRDMAQRVVYAKSYAQVWLTLQTPTTDQGISAPATAGNVLG